MGKNTIEIGDIVDICFLNWTLDDVEILGIPCATGDLWKVKNIKEDILYYVQHFDCMVRYPKKENKDNESF